MPPTTLNSEEPFYGSGCECVAADGGCGGYGGADPLGVDAGVWR